ncbi:MAG: response regulator [Chloroflexi bacterium]|nr:response regulator [Chloroflexota bacterium]
MCEHVLVAESDFATQSVLRSSLQAAGFQVLQATDGNLAWTLIQSRKPLAVLVGALLPGLGPEEIVTRMHTQGRVARIPVIVLGDQVLAEEIVHWFQLGADNYISKPFSARLVIAHLRALIRRVYEVDGSRSTCYRSQQGENI